MGSTLDDRIVIESDSLRAVNSLISNSKDISELGTLSSVFQNSKDVSFISFSHVFRSGNSPIHLLAKAALVSDIPQAWTRNIPHMYLMLLCLILVLYNFLFLKKKGHLYSIILLIIG